MPSPTTSCGCGRKQARKLLAQEILENGDLVGARISLDDFNEWSRVLLRASSLTGSIVRIHVVI
jgi:hypothetical protein